MKTRLSRGFLNILCYHRFQALIILLCGLPSAWSQTATRFSDALPTVQEIATGYTNYSQITKSVVYVNSDLALLCSGASKKDVDAARIKFGPHANTAIMIYMNPPAAATFSTNGNSFPAGSVIVKEKHFLGYRDKDGKLMNDANTGVGGMVKRLAGYDSDHDDWEYFYFEDAGKIESGKITTCVQCHAAAKNKDYVFGTWREIGK